MREADQLVGRADPSPRGRRRPSRLPHAPRRAAPRRASACRCRRRTCRRTSSPRAPGCGRGAGRSGPPRSGAWSFCDSVRMRLRRPSSLREWVAVGYGAVGIGLLPWAFWLSSSLPPAHHSAHWDVAWSGFDVGLAACFCATAIAAYRRSPDGSGALAAATGTLLLVDAWFDVILESHGNELGTAIVEAVVFELPAAVSASGSRSGPSASCEASAGATSRAGRRARGRG